MSGRASWEIAPYLRSAEKLMTEAERDEFLNELAVRGPIGDALGSELYKARWGKGAGKPALRIVYLWTEDTSIPAIMLLCFAKAQRETLNPKELKHVRQLAERWVAIYRQHAERMRVKL